MQNAIAFAYCKKHRPITVPVKELEKYTGDYILAGKPEFKFKLYITDNNLYFKEGDGLPTRFVPYAKDSFFMYENEKTDISFKEENGRMYILAGSHGEKPDRLDKVN